MKRYTVLLVAAAVYAASGLVGAQSAAVFSGSWTLGSVNPPVPAGRGGGGGGISGPYSATTFAQAPASLTIAQNATEVVVTIGATKAVYTLDNNVKEEPPGEVMALKTWSHWEGPKLHLHYKQGMNWGRDVLSLTGNTLTLVRDLESGGGSTTRTLTYSKAQ
ncbi:MAG: hypothetical protein AB7Q29_18205 [Vicinamibacterales bacterium]